MMHVVGANKTLDHGIRFLWIKGTLQQGGWVMKAGTLLAYASPFFSPEPPRTISQPSRGHSVRFLAKYRPGTGIFLLDSMARSVLE
jgi:hypothetical protein